MNKKNIYKSKILLITIIIIQILTVLGNYNFSFASLKEGDIIQLEGDHECDSLLEYWMNDYKRWSYKVVWYVYYNNLQEGKKYPAFCVEPQKEGVGTGYSSYSATISKIEDNRIWRILNKGYMGSDFTEWNLECDDDFYSATKVALHSLAEGIAPKDKYVLGDRSVDGNTVEEIRRRGEKVLNVAQILYEYGLNGSDVYEKPKIDVNKKGESKIENIKGIDYYVQNYIVNSNKNLKSYSVKIKDFPSSTKILNTKNQEIVNLNESGFKIAIPIYEISEDIHGTINIDDAKVKTNPVFYCKSSIENAQSYVTYTNEYETTNTSITLDIKSTNCNLEITKIDKETKKVIPGVKFQIKDINGNIIDEVITNDKGIAKLNNIKPQKVIVKEVFVPEPYVLSDEEMQVELVWNKTSSVTFENERLTGKIKIIKISEDDNSINGDKKGCPIENVVFEIINEKGDVVEVITTNSDGIAVTSDLEKGKYIIKEIKTSEYYELNNKEYVIEIVENKKIEEITITNKSKELPKLPRTGF